MRIVGALTVERSSTLSFLLEEYCSRLRVARQSRGFQIGPKKIRVNLFGRWGTNEKPSISGKGSHVTVLWVTPICTRWVRLCSAHCRSTKLPASNPTTLVLILLVEDGSCSSSELSEEEPLSRVDV
ncbi:hypothetical protein F2Q70_00026163 [Brassica cretica]|uniref:Uncharacterized protein n=1 Tax=Brassica cretica TaxID=69181 RepID=A0A8S9L5A5_BRACR|nr:hypothetical protein F2Q70_00026163 [Brassica cretica]